MLWPCLHELHFDPVPNVLVLVQIYTSRGFSKPKKVDIIKFNIRLPLNFDVTFKYSMYTTVS